MEIISRIIPAKPRNKELYFQKGYGSSSITGVVTENISQPTYWELITTDAEGNPLPEPYLKTKYSAISEKEISAWGKSNDESDPSGVFSIQKASDVILTNPSIDDLLKYNGTHWINIPMSSIRPDLTGYATETYVDQKITQVSTDKHFEMTVSMPSDLWNINHKLSKYPSVTVINNDLKEVVGDIEYIDLDNIKIYFSAEFSGKVICN